MRENRQGPLAPNRAGRRPSYEPPALRRHTGRQQGRVRIGGKTIWCGPWIGANPAPETVARHAEIVRDWSLRRAGLAPGAVATPPAACPDPEAGIADEPAPVIASAHQVTSLAELTAMYVEHAKVFYVRRKDGKPTSSLDCIKMMVRALGPYLALPATDFGPKKFTQVLHGLANQEYCRSTCNQVGKQIRLMFKWAVAEEYFGAEYYERLKAAPLLKKGRSNAVEPKKVKPVPDDVLAKTFPLLPPVVRDMVRFQQLTSARPGEVCDLRHDEIDRSTDHWVARPDWHKTEYADKERRILIGPMARELLLPYLKSPTGPYVFPPRKSEKLRQKERRKRRESKVQPSQRCRKKKDAKRRPGVKYSLWSYEKAIKRAAARAGVEHWAPNQIRHLSATETRKTHGLEVVQVLLGHSDIRTTQIYAEPDDSRARQAVEEIG